MDKALATGMQKVIVSDYCLYDFIKEGSIIGEGKEFPNEAELDRHIRSCMKDYPKHGAFYGVQLPDEPKYTKLPRQ